MAGGPTVTLTFAGDADKLNRAFDSVGESARSMDTNVGNSSRSINDASGALDSFGNAADAGEGKAQGFSDIIGGSTDVLQGFTDGSLSMGDRLQMLGGGVADLSGGIASFLVPALSAGVTSIKAMSMALLTSPITWIVVGIGLIVGAFILLWNKFEGFRNFWIAVWNGIKSVASSVVNGIIGIFGWFAALPGRIRGWFGAVKDGAVSMLQNLLSWVAGLPGRILSAIGNFGRLLLNVGRDLLSGLWQGIQNAASWLWDKVTGFFGDLLPGWVKDILGISSPSKVFADLGKHIPSGLAVGIEGNLAPIEDASVDMKNAAMGDYMAGTAGVARGGSGGGASVTFGGNTDTAFASAFMKLVRTGQIQIKAA